MQITMITIYYVVLNTISTFEMRDYHNAIMIILVTYCTLSTHITIYEQSSYIAHKLPTSFKNMLITTKFYAWLIKA